MFKFKNIINKITQGYAVLEFAESKINGPIEIREDVFGKRTMVAGGLAQSGKEVERIWKIAFSDIGYQISDIRTCLVLGLGAGTVAKLLNQKYPKIKITGIEIDPEIIKMGNKYFNLSKIKNLEIKVTDAISEVNNITIKQYKNLDSHDVRINNRDLILVDLYLGNQYPEQAEDQNFLKTLKKTLSPKGMVIINRLYYHISDKQQTNEFGKKLRTVFNQVQEKEINWNKFFFVR